MTNSDEINISADTAVVVEALFSIADAIGELAKAAQDCAAALRAEAIGDPAPEVETYLDGTRK